MANEYTWDDLYIELLSHVSLDERQLALVMMAFAYLDKSVVSTALALEDSHLVVRVIEDRFQTTNLRHEDIKRLLERLRDINPKTIARWGNEITRFETNSDFPEWFNQKIEDLTSPNRLYTPASVAELIAKVSGDTNNKSILDPNCGSGAFFAAAAKTTKNAFFYGEDNSPENRALAALRLEIVEPRAAHNTYTFAEPASPTHNNRKFDIVLANPPFTSALSNAHPITSYIESKLPTAKARKMSSEVAYVWYILDRLGQNGRAAILVPNGLLFRPGADEQLREHLIAMDLIEAIVALPSGLFAPHTGISVSLVVINRAKRAELKNKITFIRATDFAARHKNRAYLAKSKISEIVELLFNIRTDNPYRKVVSIFDVDGSGINLDVSRYVQIKDTSDRMSSAERLARISELDAEEKDLLEEFNSLMTELSSQMA